MALDHIFNHPNVGPFVCRQLIQRLVTSNPSPAYVYRCGQAFANNGAGVRGDMAAVVRAILLDYEARSPAVVGAARLRQAARADGALRRPAARARRAAVGGDGRFRYYWHRRAGVGPRPDAAARADGVQLLRAELRAARARSPRPGWSSPEFQITTETIGLRHPELPARRALRRLDDDDDDTGEDRPRRSYWSPSVAPATPSARSTASTCSSSAAACRPRPAHDPRHRPLGRPRLPRPSAPKRVQTLIWLASLSPNRGSASAATWRADEHERRSKSIRSPQAPSRRDFLCAHRLRRGGHDRARRTRSSTCAASPRRPPVVGDYKALVCLFLYGGNDGNNMIVPRGADYAAYAAARGNAGAAAERRCCRSPPLAGRRRPRSGASTRACPTCAACSTASKAAVVANVGPLVAPVTRAEYLAGNGALPPQLFSHSDQTVHWQTSLPDQPATTGWGGRMADLHATRSTRRAEISMSMSLGGTNTFQVGDVVTQYQVSPDGGDRPLAGYYHGHAVAPSAVDRDRALLAQELRQPLRARLPRRLRARARPGPRCCADAAGVDATAACPIGRCSPTPTSAASSR